MKIIILSFLFTTQAQLIDDQLIGIDLSTISLNDNQTTISSYETETWSSFFSDLQYTGIRREILSRREQWFNVNKTTRDNSSAIFWRKMNDGRTYFVRSDGRCVNKMCNIKLKYNGTLSKRNDGCLSFILLTRGQPVGQLWIEEDQQQESFSQKIQLTNSSLRVEHSLKSNIRNLSIDARILFRNPKIDRITLSNLNVNWKGPCPKHSKVTPIPEIFSSESTFEDDLITLTTENFSMTLITNERYEDDYLIESSTIKFDKKGSIKRSSSFINQSNIGWFLSLIISFCFLIILSSFVYGLWTIQAHYRFIWYVPFDYPIQFLARRSIRSSTRSNQIPTLSQISNQVNQNNFQQDDFDSFSTHSNRSTPSAFYTYF